MVIVEEDLQTLATMKHVEGLVAFLCSIKRDEKDGALIGQGRGSAVLNPQNRFMHRAIRAAFNSSIVDAMVKTTRVFDTLAASVEAGRVSVGLESGISEGITGKQKSYLLELIQTRVADKEDREQWMSQLDGLDKESASLAIQQFTK